MSRLTGSEVAKLMEAYSEVYASNQEVDNAEQIEEQGGQRGSGSRASQTNQSVSLAPIGNAVRSAASAVGGAAQRVGSSISQSVSAANKVPTSSRPTNVRGGGTRPAAPATPAAAPTQSRFAGARDAAFQRARAIQGSPVVGPRQPAAAPAAPAAAPAARPAAAPAAAPAARPAAPVMSPKVAPATTTAATPARPSLAQQAAELRAMRQRSQERQGVVNAHYEAEGEKIEEIAGALVKGALAAGGLWAAGKGMEAMKKKVDAKIDRARKTSPIGGDRRVPQMNSYEPDNFDYILEYLVSEGYADTNEAALVIMANMSEEWRKSIVEADSIEAMRARAAKRRQQRYGKQGGGGRDDYRPYTKDDYENPKPGYGSGAASQAKEA
jgi:hypothetical protein